MRAQRHLNQTTADVAISQASKNRVFYKEATYEASTNQYFMLK
jgi:hypothetical protein